MVVAVRIFAAEMKRTKMTWIWRKWEFLSNLSYADWLRRLSGGWHTFLCPGVTVSQPLTKRRHWGFHFLLSSVSLLPREEFFGANRSTRLTAFGAKWHAIGFKWMRNGHSLTFNAPHLASRPIFCFTFALSSTPPNKWPSFLFSYLLNSNVSIHNQVAQKVIVHGMQLPRKRKNQRRWCIPFKERGRGRCLRDHC